MANCLLRSTLRTVIPQDTLSLYTILILRLQFLRENIFQHNKVSLKPRQQGPFKEKQEQIIFIFCQFVSDDYLARQVINELQEMDLYLTGGEYVTMVTWSRKEKIRSRR